MSLSLVPAPGPAPVRFHQLKRIGRSPIHYRASSEKVTSDLEKGTALHSIILKGQRVTFYDKLTDAGKAAPRNGKDWEAFKAKNPDALILTRTEYDDVMRMAEAVQKNRDAITVLKGAVEEHLFFEYMGRACRTTPDVRGYNFATELKKARSAHPRDFKYDALRLRYHGQMAFHALGMGLSGHGYPDECWFVVVEDAVPNPVSVLPATKRALAAGRWLIERWMERLLVCEATNDWPAYEEGEFDVTEEDEKRYGIDVLD